MFMGLISCSEDKLNIEPQEPRYDLSDSETDALQHYKHDFFEKYNVIIIDDVDKSDFQYTISGTKLDLEMVKSTKTDEEKIEILESLEETFFKTYSQVFIQEFAPVRLIIADTIGRFVENRWTGAIEFEKVPLYISTSLVAIATNDDDFAIEDGTAYTFSKYGDKDHIGEELIGEIVIENILKAGYGSDWDQLFLPMFGQIRPFLYYSEWSQTYDSGFKIEFGESQYDPNDPENLFKRPFSEFPGVHNEDDSVGENGEAVEAYMNELGFPSYDRVNYYESRPPTPWNPSGDPEFGRIKLYAEQLIPMWIQWASQYNEAERQAKFDAYPELKKNYLTTQALLEKYGSIKI